MPRQFPYGDIKFYYGIHVKRQKALGNEPVKYISFIHRLRKGMNLHDAIYYPRVGHQVRDKKIRPTMEDTKRRIEKLHEENVQILTFEEMEKVEKKHLHHKPKEMARHNMKPNRLKNLRFRFISLFK